MSESAESPVQSTPAPVEAPPAEAPPMEAPPPTPSAPQEDPLMVLVDALEKGHPPPVGLENAASTEVSQESVEPAVSANDSKVAAESEGTPDAGEESLADSWRAIKEAEVRNRKERESIKKELEELKGLRESEGSELAKIREAFKENPNEALRYFGVTQDDIIHRVINDGNPSEAEVAARTKKAEEDRYASIEKKLKETQDFLMNQQAQEAQRTFTSEIKEVLNDPEFALIRDHDNIASDIWSKASAHYQQTGQVLTARDAVSKIQTEFRDALKQLASYKSTMEYMRELVGAGGTEQGSHGKSESPPVVPAEQKPRTLTNVMSSEQPAPHQREQPMSEYEQIMEAAKLIPPGAW